MLPLITPPQSTPVLTSGLFDRIWYLFLTAIQEAISILVAGTDWQTLPAAALQNGWTLDNPAVNGAVYYGLLVDKVSMKGPLLPGTKTDATLLFTLPSGYRPLFGQVVLIPQAVGGSVAAAALLIGSDGTVKLYGAPSCTNIWLNCSFPIS
jgi:hypothetical protein